MVNQKTNEPNFTTSEFPIRIYDIIDKYRTSEGLTVDGFALRCRLDRKTISNLQNGSHLSKASITVICIITGLTLEETKDLLKHAGYDLDSNSNTDKAYRYFINNRIDLDKCDKLIDDWNKSINSPYEMDKIEKLHTHRR